MRKTLSRANARYEPPPLIGNGHIAPFALIRSAGYARREFPSRDTPNPLREGQLRRPPQAQEEGADGLLCAFKGAFVKDKG